MREHHDHENPAPTAVPPRSRWWIGFGVFAVLAVVLLWEEHQAHLLGALPWLILLACPLLHVFMHGGHGHGGRGGSGGDQ